MPEHRIVELEIKISHQEQAIEALQQLSYEQHKSIEKLSIQIALLAKRLDHEASGGSASGPTNEKPPHF